MTADGTINEFSKHPIDCIRYIMGVEKRKDGRELAEKAFNHYFENYQNTENVIQSYEKVSLYITRILSLGLFYRRILKLYYIFTF